MKTEEPSISLPQAAVEWLQSRPHLSASAATSYRGEANRLFEHLASIGINHTNEVLERHWDAYLVSLVGDRSTVTTRRTGVLSTASALQAARITRSFFRYCWTRRWVKWMPGLENRRGPASQRADAPIHVSSVAAFLAKPFDADDEKQLRSRCMASLAFWGAMKPRELVMLTRNALVRDVLDGTALLHVPGRSFPVRCPASVVHLLDRYHQLRDGRFAGSGPRLPLISRLRSPRPITAHSAWSILRECHPATAQGSLALGSKALRDAFISLACEDANQTMVDVSRQTSRRKLPSVGKVSITLPRASTSCIESVSAKLAEAAASQCS